MARIIRRIILTAIIVFPILALSACGNSGSEDIKDVVNTFYDAWNNQDFENCLQLFSSDLGYTEDDLESMGEAREITGELTIADLEEPVINGVMATIMAEIVSPSQESESIEIPLVKEDGTWKLAGGGLSSRLAVEGDTVRVHYTGTLDDGTEFDSSIGGEPLEFTLGAGGIISGFENAVFGMSKGQTKTVTIPPEEAYGLHDDELLKEIEREDLPVGAVLQVGEYVTVTFSNGITGSVPIVEITDTTIVLDTNYWLAGEYLTFEITFVGVVSTLAPGGALP